ncbi:MAG: hypothetical protein ACOYXM_18285 [Actinomycetota bacterium]
MRRMITYVVVWLVAGATAVTLASVAVSTVGNQVTGSRPSPFSAEEVRAELAGEDETTTTAPASDTTTTSPPGASPPTTGGPAATVRQAPPTTAAPTQPAEIRTYNLVGGTATLRFEPSGVTVQEATPKPGFSVEVEPDGSNGWQVTFDSESHRSRVEGWWDGAPQDEVDEEDKGDEGGDGDG